MTRPLRVVLACWFIVQIVLPFTAPLQTIDLAGLLGTTHHHATTPEASAMPTDADASDPPATATLTASEILPSMGALVVVRSPALRFADLLEPPIQQTILRL